MSAATIHLMGELLQLDPDGTLYWPAHRLLAVADLHMEKASHFANKGQLLPPWDSAMTLDRLARVVRRHGAQTILFLGDSFHDQSGPTRLSAADAIRIATLAKTSKLIWLTGNHDPAAPTNLPGESMASLTLGPLTFRHEPTQGAKGEVCGHLHPKATVAVRGTSLTRACFVTNADRILLPAFGAFTGGLDIRHREIAALFPRHARAFLLGKERLYSFVVDRRPPATEGPALAV